MAQALSRGIVDAAEVDIGGEPKVGRGQILGTLNFLVNQRYGPASSQRVLAGVSLEIGLGVRETMRDRMLISTELEMDSMQPHLKAACDVHC